MGILNVTPDSFSEQGTYFDRRAAIARGLEIEREGGDILDIGGESTRPGALRVDEHEEMDRTIPVIESLLRKGLRIPISIDTTKASVAERALQAGTEIVNDTSGLRHDARLASVVARHRAALILMHMRGKPSTMQQLPTLRKIMPAIRAGLAASLRRALLAGVEKRRIIVDPGIGFGKSREQNFEIMRSLGSLANLGCPILVGPSRKSFIRGTIEEAGLKGRLKTPKGEAVSEGLLFGTAAAVAAAILNGAHIVRVHDVREMVVVARMADQMSG
jgi:dihydropteroate synthase